MCIRDRLYTRDTYLTQNTLFVTMSLVCGITYPIQYLPDWVQNVAQIFPLTPAVTLFRNVVIGHENLISNHLLIVQILVLSGICLLYTSNLDGTGKTDISTGIGFFDHMLSGFARHGLFDLTVKVTGDLEVDSHHTIEDLSLIHILSGTIKGKYPDGRGDDRTGCGGR